MFWARVYTFDMYKQSELKLVKKGKMHHIKPYISACMLWLLADFGKCWQLREIMNEVAIHSGEIHCRYTLSCIVLQKLELNLSSGEPSGLYLMS